MTTRGNAGITSPMASFLRRILVRLDVCSLRLGDRREIEGPRDKTEGEGTATRDCPNLRTRAQAHFCLMRFSCYYQMWTPSAAAPCQLEKARAICRRRSSSLTRKARVLRFLHCPLSRPPSCTSRACPLHHRCPRRPRLLWQGVSTCAAVTACLILRPVAPSLYRTPHPSHRYAAAASDRSCSVYLTGSLCLEYRRTFLVLHVSCIAFDLDLRRPGTH